MFWLRLFACQFRRSATFFRCQCFKNACPAVRTRSPLRRDASPDENHSAPLNRSSQRRSWRSGRERGRFPPRYHALCPIEIAAAAFRDVPRAPVRAITSGTGRKAVRRRCLTWLCSAAGITGPSTRRATRSSAYPTARSGCGGRTAKRCPLFHRSRRCRLIPSRLSRRRTKRTGCASTRGQGAPPGWGSASTSAGRSASGTPWPNDENLARSRIRRRQPTTLQERLRTVVECRHDRCPR